jgi:spectinomycin phosphotransferase
LALHHDLELASVVPPLTTTAGDVSCRLDAQYAITVFPFVDGVAGEWGRPIAAADKSELLAALAGLHGTPIGDRLPIRRRDNTLPERSRLVDALENLSHPWSGGHHAERVRELLAENSAQIHVRLHRFEELAARLDRAGRPLVATHGEPHPGNLIHTPAGLRLVDWDTVALAEPERDLWMLCADDDDLDVEPDAVEFYELMWTLSDIASFTDTFRHQNPHPAWVEQKWGGFVMLLKGGSTTPYGWQDSSSG